MDKAAIETPRRSRRKKRARPREDLAARPSTSYSVTESANF